jgi:hypothetical protein
MLEPITASFNLVVLLPIRVVDTILLCVETVIEIQLSFN